MRPKKRGVHYSDAIRERIWDLWRNTDKKSAEITITLLNEGKDVTEKGVRKFILRTSRRKHLETKIREKTGPLMSSDDVDFIDTKIRESNGKITAVEIRDLLMKERNVSVSERTICRIRVYLGFSPVNVKYCQVSNKFIFIQIA